MNYWLFKSEPFKYSFDDLKKDGTTHWDGVRNHLAAKHMRTMKVGDKGFFYHSNEGLEIVGTVTVTKEYYPDPTDPKGKFIMVDVKYDSHLKRPVTLKEIKADPALSEMALVKLMRLSVGPVREEEWDHIIEMSKN